MSLSKELGIESLNRLHCERLIWINRSRRIREADYRLPSRQNGVKTRASRVKKP
jgi:hypothetical protein